MATCNASSAAPSPFVDERFLRFYATHDEYFPAGAMRIRTYLARETCPGGRPDDDPVVGYLVLHHDFDRVIGPLHGGRLSFVATHDTDEGSITALIGREDEVAKAIMNYLIEQERDWSLLEFVGQYDDARLRTLAHQLAGPRLRIREIAIDPYSTLSLRWPTLASYYGDLSKRMRSNISRQARKLYSTGCIELVFSRGCATADLFDAHLDLEDRSWKRGTNAGLRRSPQRTEYFRALCSGGAGVEPIYAGVVLDGVLIAGLLSIASGDRIWCLDMSFDEGFADVGPGQLPMLLTVGEAIDSGAVSVHFLQFFGYFKERWLAESRDAVNVQLIRRPSLFDTRALIGDARRRFGAEAPAVERQLQEARRAKQHATTDAVHSRHLLGRYRSTGALWARPEAELRLPFPLNALTGPSTR